MSELQVGDLIVYPGQGVCEVVGTEEKNIGSHSMVFYILLRERDRSRVMIPLTKVSQVGVRRVADRGVMDEVFTVLRSALPTPSKDWKARARVASERMQTGSLVEAARVLLELFTLSRFKELSKKERENYNNARSFIIEEASIILDQPVCAIEDQIDECMFLGSRPKEGLGVIRST